MTYAQHEMATLQARIQSALAGGKLTDWQRQFLNDIDDRIERYGRDVRFSDKQVSKLYEILSYRSPERSGQRGAQQPPQRPIIASYGQLPRHPAGRKTGRPSGLFAWRTIRDISALALLMVAAFLYVGYQKLPVPSLEMFYSQPSPKYAPRQISMGEFTITDGDTIRLHGEPRGTRLVGFNAPETMKPQCSEEAALGRRAKARLRDLLSTSSALELQRVACSCAPGTEGTDACNYGRRCAILRADGRDVGQVLIKEGLAAPLVCGATRCPPTPRPWCS